jgi:hypothetical protein
MMFPLITSLIVGTVWVVGWSKELQAQADKKYWDALPLPGHVHKAPANNQSLQKVLLEHN